MTEQDNSGPNSSWDPVWEQIYLRQTWGQYPPEHVIRFVSRHWYRVTDRTAVHMLDLGCGPGACTWYMAREGFSVAGIDGSDAAIQLATRRLDGDGLVADLRVGDITLLPWPENYFDGVIDNATLCHNRFAGCKRAVAEVLRVLKPGGCFLSSNFTDRTWGYGTGTTVEPGGFTEVSVGPLAGKGFCLFMGRAHVDELYQAFDVQDVELASRTIDRMQHIVELWNVEAHKPLPVV